MSVQAHLDSLYEKHAKLEEEINNAYFHHQDDRVGMLKKQKLRIKDEINALLHGNIAVYIEKKQAA